MRQLGLTKRQSWLALLRYRGERPLGFLATHLRIDLEGSLHEKIGQRHLGVHNREERRRLPAGTPLRQTF